MTQYTQSDLEKEVNRRSETVWSVTRITDSALCKIRIINIDAHKPVPIMVGYAEIQERGVMQSSYPETDGKPIVPIGIGDLLKGLLAIYTFNKQVKLSEWHQGM